jgi:hypothetical protein
MPGDQLDTRHRFTRSVTVPAQEHSLARAGVRFRDAAGVHWELETNGQFNEVSAQ